MTTNTHKRPKKLRRNSMMESLGFIETPSVSHSTTVPRHIAPSRSAVLTRTDSKARTVEEIWNTTELRDDTMVDWSPVDVERRLNRGARWWLISIWVLIVGVIGAGGYWLWQNQNATSLSSVAGVRDAGVGLAATLEPLTLAAEGLSATSTPDSERILLATNDADNASRELFSAAADLPATQSSTRTIASGAATQALEASRNLTNVSAFVGAVTPILTTPSLLTDPELVDLATAATDFGSFQAKFEMVVGNLPEEVLPAVNTELSAIETELGALQGAYLDALREDDREAALDSVRALEGRLMEAWDILRSETDLARATILEQIGIAQESLRSLTG